MRSLSLNKEIDIVKKWSWSRYSGRVTQVIGMLIESQGPQACLGEICHIISKEKGQIPCQVMGFKDQKLLLMALSEISGIELGSEVFASGKMHQVPVSPSLCGRILDGLGNPIDGKGPLKKEKNYSVLGRAPEALLRRQIEKILPTGIKAIDGFLTLGQGQRIGIFSGAGVGKSTLLGTLARGTYADINVIALIGERGREVLSFIEKDLGTVGLKKSVVIVSTAEQMATVRVKGANIATAIAEYFRDQGQHVILMMDSLSRYSMALREIGLAIGEPPMPNGYPPSVFTQLSSLLERAGNSSTGSITGIYTILEEQGKEVSMAEYIRSLLDGHIILSKKYSRGHHYPPIDILESLSRVMSDIVKKDHLEKADTLRDHLQAYAETEDLLEVGAYVKGSNVKVDKVIENLPKIQNFLRQSSDQFYSFDQTLEELASLCKLLA